MPRKPKAMNGRGEQFGIARLMSLRQTLDSSPQEIYSSIISEMRTFTTTDEFQNDVSLVCVKL
ncbi:MAG: hypothetical protein HYR76_03720 [Ignavibacteria bacterium]|nr:hypothetical protein [Ignavibacteria bacterium]MBI3765871.1 hypothetical protein [Ignavibacteriales bacterium]